MKAILFDLDRTLVDVQSFTDYTSALTDVEALLGTWDDVRTPATDWDVPTKRCMGVLVALAGDPRWQQVSDAIEVHERAAVSRSQAMPGIEAALDATADLPRAVVTLVPETATREVLQHHDMPIDVIVPRRADLRPKPAPDQPGEACRLLGIEPSEAVMVGDSTWDQEAALAVGCGFIGVTNGVPSTFPAGTDTILHLGELAERL